MTYADLQHAGFQKPKMFWTKLHRWIGIAIFGLACFSAGAVNSTIYYKLTHLWHVAGTETSGKTEHASSAPDCVGVTPAVMPLPKP